MSTPTSTPPSPVRLTQFSPGAGCGCKIAPAVLQEIIGDMKKPYFHGLLVGNNTNDDAAVVDMGDGTAMVSTTDFFTPIVDDPYDFGYIAAVNAISDIYAMGATPLLALSILGWPLKLIPAAVAGEVVRGGYDACRQVGIPLAGGHSIETTDPIFGLSVSGRIKCAHIKRNSQAKAGDRLYLTKPLGIGICSTAEKRDALPVVLRERAHSTMKQPNSVGLQLAQIERVHAMTDVTGFGLLGHLLEICRAADLYAELDMAQLPWLDLTELTRLQKAGSVPGGTRRNWASYGHEVNPLTDLQRDLLADPQTSGGLLICVAADSADMVEDILLENGLYHQSIGSLKIGNGQQRIAIV